MAIDTKISDICFFSRGGNSTMKTAMRGRATPKWPRYRAARIKFRINSANCWNSTKFAPDVELMVVILRINFSFLNSIFKGTKRPVFRVASRWTHHINPAARVFEGVARPLEALASFHIVHPLADTTPTLLSPWRQQRSRITSARNPPLSRMGGGLVSEQFRPFLGRKRGTHVDLLIISYDKRSYISFSPKATPLAVDID